MFTGCVVAAKGLKNLEVPYEGRNGIGEYIRALPDPDKVLQKAGRSRADLEVILTDSEVWGSFEKRLSKLLLRPWFLRGSEKDVEFVSSNLVQHWSDLVHLVLRSVMFGYQVGQRVWELDEKGRFRVRILSIDPIRWYFPTPDGQLFKWASEGRIKQKPEDLRFKRLLCRYRPTYENPYGTALLSKLMWAYFFATNGVRLWANHMEDESRGGNFALTNGPSNDNESLISIMREQLALYGIANVPGTPGDTKITRLNTSEINSHAEFQNFFSKRVWRLLTGHTLSSEGGKNGSRAAASVATDILDEMVAADAILAAPVIENFVAAISDLNADLFDGPVTFHFREPMEVSRSDADTCATLLNSGVPLNHNFFMESMGIQRGHLDLSVSNNDSNGSNDNKKQRGDGATKKNKEVQ
jgi:hypothetical protein